MRKIACIGEAMIELSFPAGRRSQANVGFSGDALNTAVYLKRAIGSQAEVAFISALGCDQFSAQMVAFIEREGVWVDKIKRIPERLPGLYAIMTNTDGERSFTYWRENSAARMMFEQQDFSALDGFDTLYFSGITLAILPKVTRQAFLERARALRQKKGVTVIFDSNYRPGLWESEAEARVWVEAAWRITDIALPSLDDEMALFRDAGLKEVSARLKSYGIKQGAIKNGAAGPTSIADIGQKPDYPQARTVVDTTAAGDSFNGAFIAALAGGQGLQDALILAHRCAARVVGISGVFEDA